MSFLQGRNIIMMFRTALLAIIVILLAGCVGAGSSHIQKSSLQGISSIVFLDLAGTRLNDETFVFAPLPFTISDPDIVQGLVEAARTSTNNVEYPGVGHLAILACLDKNGNPIAMASLVNYKCGVELTPCKMKNGKYIVDLADLSSVSVETFHADFFVRKVYAYMMTNMKEQITGLQEEYSRYGIELEDLLFHGP